MQEEVRPELIFEFSRLLPGCAFIGGTEDPGNGGNALRGASAKEIVACHIVTARQDDDRRRADVLAGGGRLVVDDDSRRKIDSQRGEQ